MISRHWTALARKERANDYIAHLQNDTFKQLSSIGGFLKASILSRETEEGVDFLIITEWETLEAIKKFAGVNYETAVVPEIAQKMMIRYDKKVEHYEMKHSIQNKKE